MHNQSSKKHGRQVASGDLFEEKYYSRSSGAGRFATEEYNPKTYIHIAKDLCYPPIVIEELKKCKNHLQASNVMKGARNGEYN